VLSRILSPLLLGAIAGTVLYSLRAGLLEFVKGFNPPAAPDLRGVLTDQSVLLAANAFFDMIVVSR
jgi:hypothetical protein